VEKLAGVVLSTELGHITSAVQQNALNIIVIPFVKDAAVPY